jgi:hypothetical protein
MPRQLLWALGEVTRTQKLKPSLSVWMKGAMEESILLSVEQDPSQVEAELFGQEQRHKQQTCRNSALIFCVRLESHRCRQAEYGRALDFQEALSRLGLDFFMQT